MLEQYGVDLIREALQLALLLGLPILGSALCIGLSISILQTVTQIQEQTLSFVPKILGMGTVAALAMPWLAEKVLVFAERMIGGY